jgi:hypothetical protein
MNGVIQETQEIEVTKFPTISSKFEFAASNNAQKAGIGEGGNGSGEGEHADS